MLKVGVIGLGKIAQMTHLPNLAALDGVEVAALCDASPQVLSSIATRFPGVETYENHAEMLADAGIDAVVNCTMTALHPTTVSASIESGIPTFIEKPLAFNPEDADMLSRLSQRKDTLLMVGYHRRFDSGYQRYKGALETEDEIFYVRAHKYFGGYGAVRDEIYHIVGGDVPQEIADETGKELDRQLAFLPQEWRPAYRIITLSLIHI